MKQPKRKKMHSKRLIKEKSEQHKIHFYLHVKCAQKYLNIGIEGVGET